jgi:hypothetical protein
MELFFIWMLFSVVGFIMASNKGAGCAGALLGFLFGPFGLIAVYFMQGNRKTCPYCKEYIHKDATRCPKCQKDLA